MSNGAKCAGILVEGIALGGGRAACVVGVGVNCAHAPKGLGYATSCLTGEGGREVGPSEVFERLVQRFGEALDIWRAGEAFDHIRAAWLDCALGLGERIAIKNEADQREGVFEGIDATGRLLMRSEQGLEPSRRRTCGSWLARALGAAVLSARPTGRPNLMTDGDEFVFALGGRRDRHELRALRLWAGERPPPAEVASASPLPAKSCPASISMPDLSFIANEIWSASHTHAMRTTSALLPISGRALACPSI
jgi:hypothetical protein